MKYFLLIIILYCQVSYCEVIQKVEVFTNRPGALQEISNQAGRTRTFELVIHDLGAVDHWEAEFSEGLSSNEETARMQVQTKIEKMGNEVFEQQVLAAYEPLQRSIELNLMEYPAVVINGEQVIYGTDSVDLAIQRYLKWVQSRKY